MTRRHAHQARSGFTLIELMVVILIISILVALTAAVLTKVQDKARQVTAQSDMSQIGNAIGAFKTKLNANFLPAFQPASSTGGGFRLATSYQDPTTGLWLNWPEVTYLKQLFPQMVSTDNGLRLNGQVVWNGLGTQPAGSASLQILDSNQTMVFFLTGSVFTSFQGFSTNRQTPFASPAGQQSVGPFLDISAAKLDPAGHYLDPWGNPYAYLAFDPNLNAYPNAASLGAVFPYVDATLKPLNQKGVQIVSAGKDGQFGPGGAWTPMQGAWAAGYPGADDLSNFNSTPLGSQN